MKKLLGATLLGIPLLLIFIGIMLSLGANALEAVIIFTILIVFAISIICGIKLLSE